MKPIKSFAAVLAMTMPMVMGEEIGEGEKLFALEVMPIMAEKCFACHGDKPDKIKGGLDMRTREGILRGGDHFGDKVLIPGKGEESYLHRTTTRTVEDYEMPPKEADRLSEAQQASIRDWINASAPWPDEERVALVEEQFAEGEQVVTSGALSGDWQKRRYDADKLWAYRPLAVDAVPDGVHPVDWFIKRKLDEAQLAPAPALDGAKLARRMSFGLTGLPPRPNEVETFAAAYADNADAAVRGFAGRLMDTPHYGEHFGLRWLDVARYADSAGFANDFSRPNAWRYRDYVVRSFNEDKPYPDFVREQIAGDEIDDSKPEHLIATGFLRMGPWEQTSMSVFRETRQQWLDDATDAVGQAFLGHAMQCAKCHDHKFDPVPTRDYYRMMAVFSTTQLAERAAPFLASENRHGFARSDKWVKAKIASYERQTQQMTAVTAKARKEGKPAPEFGPGRIRKNIMRHTWELERTRPIALAVYTGNTIERKTVMKPIPLPKNPWDNKKGRMEKDTILTGGSAHAPGDPVTPGALSAAESLGGMETRPFPDGKGRRRLALANWIVDPKNPLTARVMVNRVWSWHFGKGIAGNPNNVGGTGGLPTHPRLLDYLADWFMDNGWSVKKLNALIVTSEAYRRDSIHPDPGRQVERDPKNTLYATFLPRRLTAEELRDAMLAVSGELNRQIGGIPARPDLNPEVAFQPRRIMGGTASVYEPDPLPEQRNRRSLYAEKLRGLRDPFMESFNQPGPDKSCELRGSSTVAPQALTLFNAREVHERALAFAARLVKEGGGQEAAVHRAFELAFGRRPDQRELDTCLQHWKESAAIEATRTFEPADWPSTVTRTVMAEKTGEPYSFEEFMPAYLEYQPDLQAADTDANTRGLAQLCLALLNLNEFSYVD